MFESFLCTLNAHMCGRMATCAVDCRVKCYLHVAAFGAASAEQTQRHRHRSTRPHAEVDGRVAGRIRACPDCWACIAHTSKVSTSQTGVQDSAPMTFVLAGQLQCQSTRIRRKQLPDDSPKIAGLPGRMPISRVKGVPARVRSVTAPLSSVSGSSTVNASVSGARSAPSSSWIWGHGAGNFPSK